ncbi:MAG: glycoside hydrolase family 92 protein [Clostridia bacterium]|nr:glycoside hydrolase family 92 protein [Clostridia bacterium]
MKNNAQFVNSFHGCGEIDLPKPEGIAAAWHFIKALTGNTHPGALLPFGKYSACAYTGGYPTGYGINKLNCGGPIGKIADKLEFIGMSHFQHSGTGAIGVYYNYALTSPSNGDVTFEKRDILAEEAAPGWYAAKLDGILAEVTVTEKAVLHRYTFDQPDAVIAIDFAHDGLYFRGEKEAACGRVTAVSETELQAEVVLHGLRWYFCAICEDAAGAYCGDHQAEISREALSLEPLTGVFRIPEAGAHTIKLAASLRSMEHAAAMAHGETASFDEAKAAAYNTWDEALSKIDIDTDDPREREIFYSNFYHTLTKPCDFAGESFFEGYGDGAFFTDLATMWDIYKTQLPLLFTLYPDISEKLLASLRRLAEVTEGYPHCLILTTDLKTESNQARMLSEHSICDAYYRGIPGDYRHLLTLAEKDAARFADDLAKPGGCEKAAHTVDMTCAFRAMADVARELSMDALAEKFAALAEQYTKAYENGLMKVDSDYYEGNRYNYSFRPTPEAKERIEAMGADFYKTELRRFFGYTDAEDFTSRFEGYNNETDMEAPAFCHYIDRNMYCEILTAGLDYMFTTGRGGIPGNNDSGGLSSCYLWNVLGLFPVSGFDTYICGTPRYDRAVMHLQTGDLVIRREGKGIYTKRVTFNGRVLEDFELSAREAMRGGELVFEMSETPV